MRQSIIQQKRKDRYQRALQIAATAGAISENGQPHTYYVASQNGRGRYLAATSAAFPEFGRCNCRDFVDFGQHNQIPCKHIIAAAVWERALTYARRLSSDHSINLSQLESRLLSDLSAGVPESMAGKLMVVLAATRHLDTQSCTDRDCATCANRMLCAKCDHDPRNSTRHPDPAQVDRSPLAGYPREWPVK